MARYSFGIWDSTSGTYLAGESVEIKDALGGTVLASTSDIGVGLLVVPNGDGTYYCDDIPAQDLWVYIDGAIQQELAGIPWDDGDGSTHFAATSAHGASGNIIGEGNVDGTTIEVNASNLRVKDGGIVEAKLGAGAVTEDKIGADEISAGKLKSDSVTTAKVLDANITGAKLASAVAGQGLKKDGSDNLAVEVSTVAEELDLGFNGSDQLKLIKSLSSEVYITNEMTFSQMMSVIDNRLRQLAEQTGIESGSFHQSLYTLANVDTTPSGSMTSPLFSCSSVAYVDGIVLPVMKTPEMRQIVVYYNAYVGAGNTGYVLMRGGSLSQESGAITNTSAEPKALYLDITSLPNWETFEFQLEMKVDAGTIVVNQVSVIARAETTSLSGATSYNADNPVE